MRNVVAHLIMTLDGVVKFDVVADTIGKLRETPEVLGDFFPKVAEEDAMLLGRVSYQEWAGYWPTSTVEPFASHINRVPKVVVSKTLASAPWGAADRATGIRGSLREAVTTLKQRPGKNIGIHASPTLVESMLHADLLDDSDWRSTPWLPGAACVCFVMGERPSSCGWRIQR